MTLDIVICNRRGFKRLVTLLQAFLQLKLTHTICIIRRLKRSNGFDLWSFVNGIRAMITKPFIRHMQCDQMAIIFVQYLTI